MTDRSARVVISAEGLVAGYGMKEVLAGVNLQVREGEIVACVGHNGAGKSTLLNVLFGCIETWSGSVFIDGRHVEVADPRVRLKQGISLVPQGNRVFDDLTISENLAVASLSTAGHRPPSRILERAWELFPFLKRRAHEQAVVLSGGEKQCLALASALMLEPRVMLLDEPSLGLAPQMAATVLGHLQKLNTALGITMLVVEQRVRSVLRISHRVYVLRSGQVTHEGASQELLEDDAKLRGVFL